jgi:hypothetical protein
MPITLRTFNTMSYEFHFGNPLHDYIYERAIKYPGQVEYWRKTGNHDNFKILTFFS